MMRAHLFQHVPFEESGRIQPWLEKNGYRIPCTRFFESMELPDPRTIDMLVILGGPMSVNEEQKFPWLLAEKRFVRESIESGIPVLGVCLGAQIIASAFGARVFPNPMKEIGWFPIHAVHSNDASLFRFPVTQTVFHWHGETFDLPPGSVRLAFSEGCENQAFQIGLSVIGLQFHLETTPELAKNMVSHCRDELVPSRFIQEEMEILSAEPDRYDSINQLMESVLAFLHPKKRP